MSQLTINLDDTLLAAAHAYAQRKGQQLDALVADWLRATVQDSAPAAAPPVLVRPLSPQVQELFGALRLPAGFDYRAELGEALEERFGA